MKYVQLKEQQTLIFTKQRQTQKISTYNTVSAVKSPRLGGISPTNWLPESFLFLLVIWFTSKLANNTEIIAFLSSGVSFWRFLRPYLIGASIVCVLALFLGMFLAPKASKGFNEFSYRYLNKSRGKDREQANVYRQINENEYIYVSYFNVKEKSGNDFSLEHFEGNKMKYKLAANRIVYNEEDSTYTLFNYSKRFIGVREGVAIPHGISLELSRLAPRSPRL